MFGNNCFGILLYVCLDRSPYFGPRYPKVTLVDPASWGAVLLALEIDHFRLPNGFMLWAESALKKRVLKQLNEFVGELKGSESVGENSPVEDAWLFKATVIPPGKGRFLQQRPEVKIAKFDVALLVQCKSLDAARELRASERWQKEEGRYRKGGGVRGNPHPHSNRLQHAQNSGRGPHQAGLLPPELFLR